MIKKAALYSAILIIPTLIAYNNLRGKVLRGESDGEWYARCGRYQFVLDREGPPFIDWRCREAHDNFYAVLASAESFIWRKSGKGE